MAMEKSLCFFQIILHQTINNGRLVIPSKFVRKYGNHLSSPVTLNVPSGGKWKVELVIDVDGGDLCFDKGWKEFADYHSLKDGHFLVFRYEGNCHFHVIILDISATEIEYPCNPGTHGQETNCDGECKRVKMEDNGAEVSIEIMDDKLTDKKRKGKSPLLSQKVTGSTDLARRMRRSLLDTSCTHGGNNGTQHGNASLENSQCSKGEFAGKFKEAAFGKNKSGQCNRPFCSSDSEEALKAAESFISISNYPSFMVVLRAYHWKYQQVYLPRRVLQRYLQHKAQMVKLEVGSKSWEVKLIKWPSDRSFRLCGGWIPFARENSLGLGDVCVFEGIKSDLFKVSIFRC